MTDINTDRMIWCDLETFGLDPVRDPILEVGFRITDLSLQTFDDFQMLIWDSPLYDELFDDIDKEGFVYQMHLKSGLWDEAQGKGLTRTEAAERMISWLSGHGIDRGDALCGSSVHFDRSMLAAQYPESERLFSYRNVDISTLKELAVRYAPEVVGECPLPKKIHRSLSDLDDTIKEFRFYHDQFLRV